MKFAMDNWSCRLLDPGLLSSGRTHLAFLVMLVCLHGSGHLSTGQQLPTRDEDHAEYTRRHKEVFYDTKLLPDGDEMRLYLNSEESYYFVVEEDRSALTIVVTPCTTEPIQWRLLYQIFPGQMSGDGQGNDDILGQGKSAVDVHARVQRYVLHEGEIAPAGTTYTIGETIAGLYTLEFTPVDGPASIKVYSSTSLADRPFPELPDDPEIKLTHSSETDITLSWKPSPTDLKHKQPVKYCIVVNHREHFPSECAAVAYKFGDNSPELPPYVGFGFRSEEEEHKPIRIRPKTRFDIFHACIGTKTSFTYHIHKDSSRRKYFFDVYAVNTRTNSSTAYVGSTTRVKPTRRVPQPMSEAQLQTFNLSLNDPVKYSTFTLPKRTNLLYVYVQSSCARPIEVELYRKGHLVNNTMIAHNAGMLLHQDAKKGVYRIRVKSKTGPALVRVMFSTGALNLPSPALPRDLSVEVLNSSSSCRSLTVSWNLAVGNHRYCLYAQRVHSRSNLSKHRRDWCSSSTSSRRRRNKQHKISCTKRNTSDTNERFVQTISGLRPGSHYRVAVYVGGGGRQWLPYTSAYISVHC